MKVIRITTAQNKQVPYLFNHVMPIMTKNKCGGKFYQDSVEINAWSDKVASAIKQALDELKIKFTEVEG